MHRASLGLDRQTAVALASLSHSLWLLHLRLLANSLSNEKLIGYFVSELEWHRWGFLE